MIRLPDGAQIEMAWKHVKYIRNNDFIVFQVVPMFEGRDVIIVPNREKWKEIAVYMAKYLENKILPQSLSSSDRALAEKLLNDLNNALGR